MRNSGKSFFLIMLIWLALLGLDHFQFKNFIPNVLYALWARPGAALQSKLLSAGEYLRTVVRVRQIIAENTAWRNENNNYLSQTAAITRLERENKLLREQLNLRARAGQELRLAKIFNWRLDPLSDTLLIDQGTAEGVAAGMAVVSGGNVLLGNVATAYQHSALVWLLADPHSQISVQIEGVIARARGNGSAELTLELITNQETIQTGAVATTSGLDRLPAGLLVGKVSTVELKGGNLFRSARLQPLSVRPAVAEVLVIIK